MRDGTELACDLFLPGSDEPAPVILKYYPYRKDDLLRGLIVPRARYFCARGYATAVLDVRGTGSSGGTSPRMLRGQEWEDGYDAVEWIAAQPWCDGAVGMTGVSYGGYSSLLTAAQNPPHLKAIAPIYAGWDLYENSHPGGMWQTSIWSGLYNAMMTALGAAPPAPDPEGRWVEIWEEHLEGLQPWLHQWMSDQDDGPRWREGSVRYGADRITAASFIIGGWHDIFVADPFAIFNALSPQTPKKLVMGPYLHVAPNMGSPGPPFDHLREIVRWFDRYLKGEDTGIEDEPPVAVWVREYDLPAAARAGAAGGWRSEKEWPPQRAAVQTRYLGSGGALAGSPPAAPETAVFDYDPTAGVSSMGLLTGFGQEAGLPLDQRREAGKSLTWMSEPLAAELEMTGGPRLVLWASSTARAWAIAVKLTDIPPHGPWALVSRAVRNAALPEPPPPGEAAELAIDLEPVSYLFGKGHRLGVMISGSDFPLVWPSPEPASTSVHLGPDRPSRLEIPVVRERDSGLPAPEFRPAPPLPEPLGAVQPLRWELIEDLIGERATVAAEFGGDALLDNGAFISSHAELEVSVSRARPAEARVEAEYRMEVDHGAGPRAVRSVSRVTGDREAFHALTAVEVEEAGSVQFSRIWNRSVPRGRL